MQKISRVFLSAALVFWPFALHAANSPMGAHDTRSPIEITSDSLEVLQADNKAIFSGHVVAIQGDVRIKSNKMTVYYAPKSDAKPDSAPGEASAIKRIDVEGEVFLTTPEETASGATGAYDVEKQQVNLAGGVVLTRGKNTLKGDTLVYDFASGKSVLNGSTTTTQTGGKTRVRALFVPEKTAQPQAKQTPEKAKP